MNELLPLISQSDVFERAFTITEPGAKTVAALELDYR